MASEESKRKMSEKAILRWQNLEYREKLCALAKAKWQDPEYREKMSCSHGKRSEPRSKAMFEIVTCPHCDKEGSKVIMKRWHFDKCPCLNAT